MHFPNHSLIVSSLYQVTQNDFEWSHKPFAQIKQEIAYAVACWAFWTEQDQKNVVYTEARVLHEWFCLKPLAENTREG